MTTVIVMIKTQSLSNLLKGDTKERTEYQVIKNCNITKVEEGHITIMYTNECKQKLWRRLPKDRIEIK